jgi:predicted  nucleic acid-binding Zn-ribbon protein
MKTVNIDKLNFVARRLRKARAELSDIKNKASTLYIELRSIEKSFNLSKGALKSWQDSYAYNYEKRLKALQEENSKLEDKNADLKEHIAGLEGKNL